MATTLPNFNLFQNSLIAEKRMKFPTKRMKCLPHFNYDMGETKRACRQKSPGGVWEQSPPEAGDRYGCRIYRTL